MTNADTIEIRSLQQIVELEDARKLESKIWGEADSIPTHQTITAVKNGGLVLGAYDGDRLIGFQYSFPGFNGTTAYLCSHVLATDVEYRNKGIGKMLKLAQREEALKLGYILITWTYDPLESINGYLNIAKLGGVCSTYITNCYGEMDDLLNCGIPSDRFLVEWNIGYKNNDDSNSRDLILESALPNSLIQWVLNEEGLPAPSATLPLPEQACDITYVAVPKDSRKIRESNLETAIEWRLKTRDIFTRLFNQGWKVTGFQKSSQADIPVNFYVLTKRN